MASVQMSQTLRDQITDNYKTQLYSAYRESHNVQPAIDVILHGIMDKDPEFAALCKLQEEYGDTLGMIKARYNGQSYYGNDKVCEKIVSPSTTLGLICNPDRPISENGTYMTRWHMAYKDEYSVSLCKLCMPGAHGCIRISQRSRFRLGVQVGLFFKGLVCKDKCVNQSFKHKSFIKC